MLVATQAPLISSTVFAARRESIEGAQWKSCANPWTLEPPRAALWAKHPGGRVATVASAVDELVRLGRSSRALSLGRKVKRTWVAWRKGRGEAHWQTPSLRILS